jgi:Phage capsid family
MPDHITDAGLRLAHRGILSAADAVGLVMNRSEQRELSLVEGITSLRSGHGLSGYNREHLEERARISGQDFDPQNPVWPYSILSTRATPLTVNPMAANGGDLVYSENQQLTDIFRPNSPMLKSGVTLIGGLQANAKFPSVIQDVGGQWLSPETATITDVPPVLGSVATSPKTFGITVRWSNQLQRQVRDIENDIRGVCAKAAIEGVDLAAINGAGSAGVPLGLLNQSGIGAQSGAAYSHANSLTTREMLADLNVDDDAIAWLGNPAVRTILGARERAPGDKFIWDEDVVTDRDARVSNIVPSGTLIAGDFSQLVYCFYGPGFQIDVTPFASALDFQTGIMALRLMVSVDVVLLHPTAFVAITSVS